MYFYLYDSFLNNSKYEKELSEIENYLTDLGISGMIERVSLFKNIKDILNSAAKKGAKTIVIVGNDKTFREAINFIPDFKITFGFIPVGEPSYIAQFLGIREGLDACDTLSARMIEKIDVGKITTESEDNHEPSSTKYFLGAVVIPKTLIKMKCNEAYSIILKEIGNITICNTPFSEEIEEYKDEYLDPRDGKLDVFISTSPSSIFKKVRWLFGKNDFSNRSHFIVEKIKIESEKNIQLFVDKTKTEAKKIEIGIAEEKIRLIIGKERLF